MNQESGIRNRMTFVLLAAFLILNFAFYIAIPAHADTCVAVVACPPPGTFTDGPPCAPGTGRCVLPAAAPSPAGPAPTAVELPNPLGTKDFTIIVGNIIKVFTGGAGFIALLMFVYGGFQWLTAAGNPEKIKKGKDILLWSILGLVVMFSSYIITNYLLRAILTGVVNP